MAEAMRKTTEEILKTSMKDMAENFDDFSGLYSSQEDGRKEAYEVVVDNSMTMLSGLGSCCLNTVSEKLYKYCHEKGFNLDKVIATSPDQNAEKVVAILIRLLDSLITRIKVIKEVYPDFRLDTKLEETNDPDKFQYLTDYQKSADLALVISEFVREAESQIIEKIKSMIDEQGGLKETIRKALKDDFSNSL